MYLVDMVFNDMDKITTALTGAHKLYLEQEYQSGKLMFGGRKVPRTGGLLISRHTSEDELKQVLDLDPFVRSGAVNYSITEFEAVMASSEFEHILT